MLLVARVRLPPPWHLFGSGKGGSLVLCWFSGLHQLLHVGRSFPGSTSYQEAVEDKTRMERRRSPWVGGVPPPPRFRYFQRH